MYGGVEKVTVVLCGRFLPVNNSRFEGVYGLEIVFLIGVFVCCCCFCLSFSCAMSLFFCIFACVSLERTGGEGGEEEADEELSSDGGEGEEAADDEEAADEEEELRGVSLKPVMKQCKT